MARRRSRATLTDAALAALLDKGLLAVGVLQGGRVAEASAHFLTVFGLSAAGSPLADLVSAADRDRVITELARAAEAGRTVRVAFRARRADGTPFDAELAGAPLALPGGTGLAVVATDVTLQSRAHEQLSYLAFLDPLTGLPNRALVLDRVRQVLTQSQRSPRTSALFVGDLDGFKQVNDTLGHEAGDAVLQAVGQRLATCVRDSDTVARLGGDEFAVLLPRITQRDDAALVAGRMVRAMEEPIPVGGRACRVGISIGIATSPDDGADLDLLMARADAAMYEAKRAGKNRFAFAERGSAPHTVSIPFVVWGENHDVGWAAMDEQHRGLADRINRLGDDLKACRDTDRLLATLGGLVAYTQEHFATEGRLLDTVPELPSAEAHREEHRRLLDNLRSLTVGLDAQNMSLTMRYLQEWLLRHVHRLDMPLARALRECGLAQAV